jgi:hypothetical protein
MKRLHCDFCDKPSADTIQFVVDRKLDAAGSSDDVVESLDVCQVCLVKAVVTFMRNDYVRGQKMYDSFPVKMTEGRLRHAKQKP